ncbi:twin-arginine translocase TatA/TatE family subunit [Alkaliphilus oremlandii]|uniref:Sec-independent protein translocase protein TatA n=1 Tax=Alkaliphilus oremlandii (strain OhILAs) TaxID=350688 RepID=A8MLJ6_ALKOO|nr:twin-arginine translocase TatA/TatE family subunit [Alkaliphilus oremlandii]ABW18110.1 sec-independent translocation protein mttA/Hcf106 [Alkaliphilus oremlandii OhILAs]
MFGKIGTGELILILGIALVIFGPAKLPELGKALGRGINEFKSHANKVSEDVKEDPELKDK